MKIYSIYADKKGNYQVVKRGWSWPAFLFTVIWAIKNNVHTTSTCRFTLLCYIIISFVIMLLLPVQSDISLFLQLLMTYTGFLLLALGLIMGANGNQWLRTKLLQRGYAYQEIILADNQTAALTLYIKENKDKTSIAA